MRYEWAIGAGHTLNNGNTAVQSQKAVAAYCKYMQLLPFDFNCILPSVPQWRGGWYVEIKRIPEH